MLNISVGEFYCGFDKLHTGYISNKLFRVCVNFGRIKNSKKKT
jgi:hypothetical protein